MGRVARMLILALSVLPAVCLAQTPAPPKEVQVSVDAGLLLDAAGPEQRKSLGAIYLIACRTENGVGVGSGFLLENGVIVTNSHVVGACTEQTLTGVSSTNKQ